ncbi:hypothetical protein TSUD_112600 [Trifolium subterraneum]|uniref:ALA-interacting subunit n=1 Tax=Trifolium subterraneum TaxID=3900 RepID=A0A2Z6MGZ5_TRISU|nr:hypothetical protein TSUD_112600 [Trifolium subterraneum]
MMDMSPVGGKEGQSPPNSKKTSKKPKCMYVISTFTVIGIIFIPVGLASLFSSEKVEEAVFRYDDTCLPSSNADNAVAYIKSATTNKTCTHKWTSRNDKQLWNKASEGDTSNCNPEDKTKGNAPIVPCGLIAWSLFNDTYKFSMNNKDLTVNKKNIAWSSDRGSKFGPDVYPKNFQSGELIGGGKLDESIPLSEQEDLIVWMRTAALPTFRKLYGKIEADLEANSEIDIVIQNNYNTYEFGGKKNLVLSTTTWIGGKNPFLGMAYLVVGGLSLFCAIGFILLYVIKPRPLGDPSYLSWNRNPGILK